MKILLILSLIFILLSGISFAYNDINYNNEFSLKLIEHSAECLQNCKSVIELKPMKEINFNMDTLNLNYLALEKSKETLKYIDFKIYKKVINNNLAYYYGSDCITKNECITNKNRFNTTSYITYSFMPINKYGNILLYNNETYIIEITGKKDVMLNENNYDWVLSYNGIDFNEWAFWNSSYSKRLYFEINNSDAFNHDREPKKAYLLFPNNNVANCTKELRLTECGNINTGFSCPDGSETEITHRVIETSNSGGYCKSATITFLSNTKANSNRTYGVYYNNSNSDYANYSDEIYMLDNFEENKPLNQTDWGIQNTTSSVARGSCLINNTDGLVKIQGLSDGNLECGIFTKSNYSANSCFDTHSYFRGHGLTSGHILIQAWYSGANGGWTNDIAKPAYYYHTDGALDWRVKDETGGYTDNLPDFQSTNKRISTRLEVNTSSYGYYVTENNNSFTLITTRAKSPEVVNRGFSLLNSWHNSVLWVDDVLISKNCVNNYTFYNTSAGITYGLEEVDTGTLNVTQNFPPDNYIYNDTSVTDFVNVSCNSSASIYELATLSFYLDDNFMDYVNISGFSNYTTFGDEEAPNGVYNWACEVNNTINTAYRTANRQLTINMSNRLNITLLNPFNNSFFNYSEPQIINFGCYFQSRSILDKGYLYLDGILNQTQNFPEVYELGLSFDVYNMPNGTHNWTCAVLNTAGLEYTSNRTNHFELQFYTLPPPVILTTSETLQKYFLLWTLMVIAVLLYIFAEYSNNIIIFFFAGIVTFITAYLIDDFTVKAVIIFLGVLEWYRGYFKNKLGDL